MISSLLNSSSIPVLEQVLNFSEARHAVLAGNIANLDTPGYQVHDLSPEKFQSRLKDAITSMRSGNASSLSGVSSSEALANAGKGLEDLLYYDGSTGSLEKQIAAMTKNQMQHNLAVSILGSQFRLLQAAISEKV